jgi:hypothetical protein
VDLDILILQEVVELVEGLSETLLGIGQRDALCNRGDGAHGASSRDLEGGVLTTIDSNHVVVI